MQNIYLKNIINLRNKKDLSYKTFHAKSEKKIFDNYNSKKNLPFYYNFGKIKNQKLYSSSKKKLFMKQIKEFKENKKRINLFKLNKFHQFYIHNKINSEFQDYNELATNNKTTLSDENFNNLSNNKNKKNSTLRTTNIIHYNNNVKRTRNRNYFNTNYNFKTEFDSPSSFRWESNKLYSNYISINNTEKNNFTVRNQIQSHIDDKTKNSFSLTLKPSIKSLNYKFNDIIGSMDNNLYYKGQLTLSGGKRRGLTEQILSKFRYNIINELKNEFYEKNIEKHQNPLTILKKYEIFQKTNENYYNIFLKLSKKYYEHLYLQISDEKYKLDVLLEEREKLKEANVQINKKIALEKEKLKFYQNFMKLLMKIKFNTPSLDDIPEAEIKKYGLKIAKPKFKRFTSGIINFNQKYVKNPGTILITDIKKYSKISRKKTVININYSFNQKHYNNNTNNKYNNIYDISKEIKNTHPSLRKSVNIPKKFSKLSLKKKSDKDNKFSEGEPIFNDPDELNDRLNDIINYITNLFKESDDKKHTVKLLKIEKEKEKLRIKADKNIQYNNYELQKLSEELLILKEENELYLNLKDFISSAHNNNYIEYKYKIVEKKNKEDNIETINFVDKLISILLNLNINIEKLIGCKGIYRFLKSPQEIKFNNDGKDYMKGLFCVKILEMIFLKLMEKRREYLKNKLTRKRYLEYKEIIEKEYKIKKIYEKRKEEYEERMNKRNEILIKGNKITFLPIRKEDPFSNKLSYEKFKKKEKEHIQKMRKKEENDNIYNNYINY